MNSLGLVINEDCSHFYGSRSENDMTMDSLIAFIDQYAGTQVSHLFLNPNSQRTSFASKVWENIWTVGDRKVPQDFPHAIKWINNTRKLFEMGIDPYSVWITRCREKKISPWITMRMNDIHNVDDPTLYIHNSFWVNHPEYWRVQGAFMSWMDRAFDYAHPEVREHHMKLVREYFERYDFDGFELDWMRFGHHFAPGREVEGCEILTRFMSEVRQLAKDWSTKRGHPIQIAARVPARPIAARGLGMDGVRWVKEGLVDMLIPTPFFTTSDFDIPMELWKELSGEAGKKVIFAAGHELLVRPSYAVEPRYNDFQSVCGFVASAFDRGADQIYLFNYMDSETTVEDPADYQKIIHNVGRLETVLDKVRRHVVTFPDTLPLGVPNPIVLPTEVNTDKRVQLRIHTGSKPQGGKVTLCAGLAESPTCADARFEARMNSYTCKAIADGDNPQLFSNTKRMLRFDVPLSAMNRGYNLAEIYQTSGEPQTVSWGEIQIDPS
jgi:hypothetical protein